MGVIGRSGGSGDREHPGAESPHFGTPCPLSIRGFYRTFEASTLQIELIRILIISMRLRPARQKISTPVLVRSFPFSVVAVVTASLVSASAASPQSFCRYLHVGVYIIANHEALIRCFPGPFGVWVCTIYLAVPLR